MCLRKGFQLALLLLGCFCVQRWLPPVAGQETNAVLRTLTQVAQVLALSRSEAERQHPVQLEGVVTYSDSLWGLLFVQDATAGIFVDRLSPPLTLKPGDLLSIRGVTGA